MKSISSCCICICILLFFGSQNTYCQKKTPNHTFYNDTSFDYNGLSIRISDSYLRKKLFIRTTVSIQNTTDNYILIDPKKVLLSTSKLSNEPCLYRKLIVIPPKYNRTFYLKLSGSDTDADYIQLDFSKIGLTDKLINKYSDFELKYKDGADLKMENIELKIIDRKPEKNQLVVRMELHHKGEYFLAINYHNIGIKNGGNGICYNQKKDIGKFSFSSKKKEELLKLVFDLNCLTTKPKERNFTFENVFNEYSIKEMIGPKLKLRRLSDEEASKKPDVRDQEIEEID